MIWFSPLSSNLYQPQKLMSIDLDPPAMLPVNKRDNPLNLPINGIQDKPGFPDTQLSTGGSIVSDHPTFLSMLAFLSTGLVVLFLINQYYRRRSRPKRKRPRQGAKPRRAQQIAYGIKMPGV